VYELQDINQNITQNLYNSIKKAFEKNHIIYIIKAIEYAIRKELPNEPKYIIDPIIIKATKEIQNATKIKTIPFKSSSEAQELFKKHYKPYLDLADKQDCSKEYRDVIEMSYDLAKYDKKLIYEDQEYLFNTLYLLQKRKEHFRADQKWLKLKSEKPDEINFNIAHNTNKSIKEQISFLNPMYKPYKANPYTHDLGKQIELNIIDGFKSDNYTMARSISAINDVKYDIEKLKYDNYSFSCIKSFKTMKNYLDADQDIERKDIINSWLTNIAFLYSKVNPQGIPKTKLANYINTVAKYTTIYNLQKNKYIFSPEKLREATYREYKIFKNLRLLEITNKRKKLTKSEESKLLTERYMKNVTKYLHKYAL